MKNEFYNTCIVEKFDLRCCYYVTKTLVPYVVEYQMHIEGVCVHVNLRKHTGLDGIICD